MKNVAIVFVCFAVIAGVSAIARADWNPGDESLFQQLPNLGTSGIDINATNNLLHNGYYNGDDFVLNKSAKIVDLHIWGSWKNDLLPDSTWWLVDPDTGQKIGPVTPNPGYVKFHLGIFADVPAYTDPIYNYEYSTPGNMLWSMTFNPNEAGFDKGWFTTRSYAENLQEGFMNPLPPLDYVFPGDTKCYQYNFGIPEALAFNAQAGHIYWLVVTAEQLDTRNDRQFGWKTSMDQWNDKAVATQGYNPGYDYWQLITRNSQTYNMSFVVTPEPGTLCLLAFGALALLRRRA